METDNHLKCANVLCGWCSNISVYLTASLQRSNRLRRDLATVDKKINGIMQVIEDGLYRSSMKARLAELEREKQTLSDVLEHSSEPPVLRLHPSLANVYRSKVRNLSSAL